jgi:hypothetical protein
MSLFENDNYRWRGTYFVLFDAHRRLTSGQIAAELRAIDSRNEVFDIRENENGFESLTMISPSDFAGMDVTCMTGEEVKEQASDLIMELQETVEEPEDQKKIDRLAACDAQFEIYHFQQITDQDDDDEMMDPGSLLVVLERLAEQCDGVAVDPQSSSFM